MPRSPAIRRYNRRVIVLSIIYAAALFTAEGLFRQGRPHGAVAYAVAVMPAFPIVGIFAVMGRYLVEERDEYLRALTTRQSLVATAFALSIATVWGFAEDFGVAPHVPAYYVAVLWFGGLGLGSCVNRIIERRGGEA